MYDAWDDVFVSLYVVFVIILMIITIIRMVYVCMIEEAIGFIGIEYNKTIKLLILQWHYYIIYSNCE